MKSKTPNIIDVWRLRTGVAAKKIRSETLCQRPDRKSAPCPDWLATCGGGAQSLFDENVAGSGNVPFQPAPGFPSEPQSRAVPFHLLEAKSGL